MRKIGLIIILLYLCMQRDTKEPEREEGGGGKYFNWHSNDLSTRKSLVVKKITVYMKMKGKKNTYIP